MAATTTEPKIAGERAASAARPRAAARKGGAGTDRVTIVLLTVAAFLVVLGMLATQIRPSATITANRPVVVLKRVYETRIVTTLPSGEGAGGNSVTQSVSSSGSAAPATAPTTRSS